MADRPAASCLTASWQQRRTP